MAKRPEQIPPAVTAAIVRFSRQHNSVSAAILETLQWDAINGCYYFTINGMYHGVELIGYIHT